MRALVTLYRGFSRKVSLTTKLQLNTESVMVLR